MWQQQIPPDGPGSYLSIKKFLTEKKILATHKESFWGMEKKKSGVCTVSPFVLTMPEKELHNSSSLSCSLYL